MFFAPKFSYVIEYFILLFHHKQILVSVNISSLGLVAPVPAGSRVPQLTGSLEGKGKGEGAEDHTQGAEWRDNIGRLLICCALC